MKNNTVIILLGIGVFCNSIAGMIHLSSIRENTKRIDRLEALPYITLSDMRQAALFTNALPYNTNSWKHNTP